MVSCHTENILLIVHILNLIFLPIRTASYSICGKFSECFKGSFFGRNFFLSKIINGIIMPCPKKHMVAKFWPLKMYFCFLSKYLDQNTTKLWQHKVDKESEWAVNTEIKKAIECSVHICATRLKINSIFVALILLSNDLIFHNPYIVKFIVKIIPIDGTTNAVNFQPQSPSCRLNIYGTLYFFIYICGRQTVFLSPREIRTKICF